MIKYLYFGFLFIYLGTSLNAQEKKLPVGIWKSEFRGGEVVANITDDAFTLTHWIQDPSNSEKIIEKHKSEFKIIKVSFSEMSEPKGSISLTNPDGDDMTLSFLWRANDEILLQEFHMVLYSEEKLRSLQSFPKVSLNDRKKV